MIDIHCHILPGIDDGAATMQDAMMMAAAAADDGIRTIIATPHITWDGHPLDKKLNAIRSSAQAFKTELKNAGIPLRIVTGAEVLCVNTEDAPPTKGAFPCIEGTLCSLLEFPFHAKADKIESHITAVRSCGILPIIAHPERYRAVQKDRKLLERWIRVGCLIQINKGSFQGQFGFGAKKTAHKIMEDRLAAFMATDAHDFSSRSPRLKGTRRELEEKYGADYLHRLTYKNPASLLQSVLDEE